MLRSAGEISAPHARMQARSMQFSSSRTLPGQSYSSSARTLPVNFNGVRLQLAAILCGEEFRQLPYVGPALAQRRDVNGEDREAEVEVFAKLFGRDRGFQIAVGRGDDANIDVDIGGASEPRDLPLFEHAQQLRLNGGRDLAYLVQKDRASRGKLELPDAPLVRARVSAFFVAEQLIFDQRVGDGRAVDGDKRRVAARAQVMYRAREELLAGAGFAEQQNGRGGRGHLLYLAPDFLHRRRIAYDAREPVAPRVLFSEQNVLGAQARFFKSALDEQEQVAAVDGLLQKFVSALFHRLHRFIDGAVGGQQYDGSISVRGLRGSEDFKPVCARHLQIGYHETVPGLVELAARFRPVACLINGVACILKRQAQHLPQALFIFYQ